MKQALLILSESVEQLEHRLFQLSLHGLIMDISMLIIALFTCPWWVTIIVFLYGLWQKRAGEQWTAIKILRARRKLENV